ncbi:HNH endonuclease [Microbacterium sp. p3-SID131]|uniref:HNH endonuclease n=1 Tax=Microbacterium sp. p3-SID131 TaxID=2916215 RepID=UPI0021A51E6B|nr:HNH endonuclease [Microbacterium sp. p3-SID131]MCT1363341.1 HNH endonuclease [Microbacterium sp. p3-SID131]
MTLTTYAELEQGEVWRAVPGFEGYEVSNLGRVRSFRRHGGRARGLTNAARQKSLHVGATGYLCVTLQKPDGNRCSKYPVHSLVAAAFLGPRPDGMQVAHSDGDRQNARLDNLRYATATENATDKRRHGTDTPGERNGMHKLTDASVREIRRLRSQGAVQTDLAKKFGVSRAAIQFVLNGQHWSHVKD